MAYLILVNNGKNRNEPYFVMIRTLQSLNTQRLQAWENAMIQYMYKVKWNQTWDEKNIPKDIVKSICTHAHKLSDSFTLDRTMLEKAYFNKKDVQFAYLLYFHLANVVRVASALKSYLEWYFSDLQNKDHKKPIKVLDLGSGWGASAWALNHVLETYWPDVNVEMTLTDHSQKIMHHATTLFSSMPFKHVELRSTMLDLEDVESLKKLRKNEKFDLIIAANVLNETDDAQEINVKRVFEKLWFKYLSREGAFVIVEPALMVTSKKLTELRDHWIKEFSASTPLPCMHQKNCPMNSDEKDWCHFETLWEPPQWRQKIEKALNHKHKPLKASYVVLSKKPNLQEKYTGHRVISNELKLRDGLAVVVCTEEGKKIIPLEKNKKRDRLYRGDVIEMISS